MSSSLIPFLIKSVVSVSKNQPITEQFDSSLSTINSIDKASRYVDKLSRTKEGTELDTLRYVQAASKFIKNRFFHGHKNLRIMIIDELF
jgi:hypothetical protein